MNSLALSFNNVNFNPISQGDSQIWLTSAQLAEALEYKSSRSITNLFNANQDEFDETMTKVVKLHTVVNPNEVIESVTTLKTKGLMNKMRIFSLRGCHLIAMFARTAKAKEFRIWVLNVLAKEVGEPVITRNTISPEQQKQIRFAIAKRCQNNSVHYQTVYTAMYEHFNIPRYAELLVSDFGEAIKFIQTVDLTPQIEMSKPFEMQEFSVTSQVVEYLQTLRREITRLGGVIPTYPTLDDETIVQSVVTRMVQSHRMMLSFDPLDGARIKLIPQNNWLVTEENIASIIGNADGIRKDKLPDIMSALLSRIGLTK